MCVTKGLRWYFFVVIWLKSRVVDSKFWLAQSNWCEILKPIRRCLSRITMYDGGRVFFFSFYLVHANKTTRQKYTDIWHEHYHKLLFCRYKKCQTTSVITFFFFSVLAFEVQKLTELQNAIDRYPLRIVFFQFVVMYRYRIYKLEIFHDRHVLPLSG